MVAKNGLNFKHVYAYKRETKGTWVYEATIAEGSRISGTNAIYLLKSEFPTKPGETVTATFEITKG
jgi:beta-lactam-binding protein with PASTA domain